MCKAKINGSVSKECVLTGYSDLSYFESLLVWEPKEKPGNEKKEEMRIKKRR